MENDRVSAVRRADFNLSRRSLCGKPPYGDGDQMSVMYQHVQGKAKPVKALNPNIPDAVSELVRRMMVVDKLKRIQSMEDVRRELQVHLN